MRKNEFLCEYCKRIFLKSEKGFGYAHGDIKLLKKFNICTMCSQITKLNREKKQRKDRHRRIKRKLGACSDKVCDMCNKPFLAFSDINNIGGKIPRCKDLIYNYPFNRNAKVCRFCVRIKKEKLEIPVIYLFYSNEQNLYKIGQSLFVYQRIVNIRSVNNTKDWEILSVVCFPNSSKIQREEVEKKLEKYFYEYSLGHEYFDLRLLHNPIEEFEGEARRAISDI
ncbi:MAG TPA: hypothetical protein EYG94_00020 [Campylobacterales bacterium]|nr:hypothetical protein [Campylobacterales bacterium]